jgi:triacylglycerol lipase
MSTTSIRTRRRTRRRNGRRQPLMWREALCGLDWLSLRFSPVYLGQGVPHGDGSPVILVPGFLTTDAYLMEIYFWLRRIGYSPFLSRIGVNASCIQELTQRLDDRIVNVHTQTGRRVRLIGHSLGGLLARAIAARRPEIVSQLISLGTPIQALEAHPAIWAAAGFMRKVAAHLRHAEASGQSDHSSCLSESCQCLPGRRPSPCPPASVHRAALFTRSDGVLAWRNCLESDPGLNYDVGGTHMGLVFNAHAYRIVATLLAGASRDRGEGRR